MCAHAYVCACVISVSEQVSGRVCVVKHFYQIRMKIRKRLFHSLRSSVEL